MRYLLVLLLGLVVGGAATIFFLGTPRAKAIPGTKVQTPGAGGDPPSTVVVSMNSGFVDEMLASVFRDLGPPSFNLSQTTSASPFAKIENAAFQSGCANSVTLAAEGEGVKTAVQFANGNISAPLVFSGSYALMGNCMQFKGWAQTTIQLSFDQPAQTLYGRVNVEGVNLEGVAPFANSFVTVFVRTAIDQRINPLMLLRPSQLQLMIPVKGSNGTVKAHVKDVRSEVRDGMLRLHITYDFSGEKGQQPQT
ncbi:MAG TPA: hypothetical protein VN951_07395 [Pyrinomonadaceae bacterium]|nr:hypothetical protein [Pyrinomonadaceae bacterium]